MDNENKEAVAPESGATSNSGVEIKKRFASHVMETVAGKHYPKVIGLLQSTENLQEGLAKALYMVMEVARKKMQKEGVEVPPELYVGKEGLLAASMLILLQVITKDGIKPAKEDIQQAIAQVSQLLTQAIEGGKQQPPPQQPEQAPPQGAQPAQGAPMQPPQGLLNKGVV